MISIDSSEYPEFYPSDLPNADIVTSNRDLTPSDIQATNARNTLCDALFVSGSY